MGIRVVLKPFDIVHLINSVQESLKMATASDGLVIPLLE